MSSKPKTSRREHSSETIAIIWTLQSLSKSHDEIVSHLQLSKFIVITICLFIDESMKRDHVSITSLNLWILNHLIVDLPSLTSFRKSHHFQLTTIVLRACSLLVDWNSCHPRSKDESTLISLYSSSHRSEDENHSTAKKQTFETPNFATKRSIDSAR
jgi:hypothetical protein